MAEGYGHLNGVSFVRLAVTVRVVFCVIELSSTACTIVGITKASQKTTTIKPAIALFLALGVITSSDRFLCRHLTNAILTLQQLFLPSQRLLTDLQG